MIVHDLFDIEGDSAGALIQDGILWLVVEQTRHGNTLLVTARERITPFTLNVPAALTLNNVADLQEIKDLQKVVVTDALSVHLSNSVRIDYLVAQRAQREVGALRDIGEVGAVRLGHATAVDWPETTERTEHTALTTTVGTDHEQVLAGLDVEAQTLEEHITSGADDRHLVKGDIRRALCDFTAVLEDAGLLRARDAALVQVAAVDVVHDLDKLHDTRSVACKLREILVAVHDAAERIRRREQQTAVRDEHLCAGTSVGLGAAATGHGRERGHTQENGRRAYYEANGTPEPLDHTLLKHAMRDAHVEHVVDVLDKREIRAVNEATLKHLAAEERNLLGVLDEARVARAVLTLELLLSRGELAKWRRDVTQQYRSEADDTRREHKHLHTHRLTELIVVQENVKDRQRNVAVERRQRTTELACIFDNKLVRVADAVVQVAQLVEHEVRKIPVLDEIRETLTERHGHRRTQE